MQKVPANEELKYRISYEATGKELNAMICANIQSGFGDEWIRFGATSEHTVDGSFSERTMAMSVAFPGTKYRGNITTTQNDLNAWVEKIHRAGIQVNCHGRRSPPKTRRSGVAPDPDWRNSRSSTTASIGTTETDCM